MKIISVIIVITALMPQNLLAQGIPFAKGLTNEKIYSSSFLFNLPLRNGNSFKGTCFFISYNKTTYFITAKHNLFDLPELNRLTSDGTFTISLREDSEKNLHVYNIDLKEAEIIHHERIDIALIELRDDLPDVYKIQVDFHDTPTVFMKDDSVRIVGFPSRRGFYLIQNPRLSKAFY
jgi:hypothetical protein